MNFTGSESSYTLRRGLQSSCSNADDTTNSFLVPFINKNPNKNVTCNKLKKKKKRATEICKFSLEAQANCETTCDTCNIATVPPGDCVDTYLKFMIHDVVDDFVQLKKQNCEWFYENSYCASSETVRSLCPVSCDSCPSTNPSEAPSITMIPSQKPSFSPSTAPSISEKPSEESTVSSEPTTEPSAQPTDSPSVSMMPSTSTLPSFQPSTKPSNQPSTSMQPTPKPSDTPSIQPSTSLQPTLSCEPDSELLFRVPVLFKKQTQSTSCKKLNKRDKIFKRQLKGTKGKGNNNNVNIEEYCKIPEVSANCQTTCNSCYESVINAPCEDIGIKFRIHDADVKKKKSKNCEWYKKNDYCDTSGSVQDLCKVSCNTCSGIPPDLKVTVFYVFTVPRVVTDDEEDEIINVFEANSNGAKVITVTLIDNPVRKLKSWILKRMLQTGQTRVEIKSEKRFPCADFSCSNQDSIEVEALNNVNSIQMEQNFDNYFGEKIVKEQVTLEVEKVKGTQRPSAQPSEEPTAVPSLEPSGVPSLLPSLVPSLKPSQVPSDVPSLKPSQVPSLKPSQVPSQVPSLMPSQVPSLKPSQVPSLTPSQVPSLTPSQVPSMTPSQVPSLLPSLTPSQVPSLTPSQVPSLTPSQVPSVVPSLTPSQVPSVVPSLTPSQVPSLKPSPS